ncbi:glycoside hydrolase family 76 protein [Anaerohalosphaera lusitana]|nr:glycoside hydrolase family 76 protein [Anaerohalosphaera lusitana]
MVILIAGTTACCTAGADSKFARWGRQTLEVIERDHRIEGQSGYYEDQSREDVSFTWGNAILLLAYAEAAKVDPAYEEPLENLHKHIQAYWVVDKGIGGYDALPEPREKVDRYYDDNAWIAMAQIDAYHATGKDKYLQAARRSIQFSLSGMDTESGGIWWRETWERPRRKSKNTCSVAPTAFACLRFYEVTKEKSYLENAKDLLIWLDENLKDEDNIYFDSVRPSGRIGRRKWSYNSAMPMRCYIVLHKLTGENKYLEKAVEIAVAAHKRWFDSSTNAIKCESMFAFTLVEGWIKLSEATRNPKWKQFAENAMVYVHENVKDPVGRYSKRWDDKNTEPLNRWNLLFPAATARAYWALVAANTSCK